MKKYYKKIYILDKSLLKLEEIMNSPNYMDYKLVTVIKDKGAENRDIYVAFLQKEDK